MLIPYHTDAPLYHRPLATIGLILLNTAIFAITVASVSENGDASAVQPWMLRLGEGLHPVQWLTSNFLHADIMHLVGNMLGLWVFGLIVEGKIGWRRFVTLYLGVGIVAMGIFQLLALGVEPNYGLGASGVIYALIGMAVIWAPENSVRFCLLLIFYPYTFEMTVWATSVWYIGFEFLVALWSRQVISSSGIHLIGASLGVAAGVVMVRRQWVDCEYWDLFSVRAGLNHLSREERAAREAQAHPPTAKEQQQCRQRRVEQIRVALDQGQAALALAAHRKMVATDPDWRLPEELLRRLVAGCLQQKMIGETIFLMREYLEQHSEYALAMRLKLAEVLLLQQQRPAQALRVLTKLPLAELTDQHRHYCRQIAHRARAMLDQGALEPEVEDW